jgi:hypothetical protein
MIRLFQIVLAVLVLISAVPPLYGIEADSQAPAENVEATPAENAENVEPDPAENVEKKSKWEDDEPPVQRINAFIDYYKTPTSESAVLLVSYTRVMREHHLITGTALLIEPDFDQSDDRGLGDTLIQYSYEPYHKLNAHPWTPSSLGSGIGLVIPTGELGNGSSVGSWVAIPTLGFVIPATDWFYLFPAVKYFHSFQHQEGASQIRAWEIEVPMRFVPTQRVWFGLSAALVGDLESDDTLISYAVDVGWRLTPQFAMSLEYNAIASGDGNFEDLVNRRFDARWALNFAFGF